MKQSEPDNSKAARQALGTALRTMHQMSGRTLRSVERDISVSDSTLSRYFRGQAIPTWPTTEKICAALGGDPAGVRQLWVEASAEKCGRLPDATGVPEVNDATGAPGAPGAVPGSGAPRRRDRLAVLAADRHAWLAGGLAVGLAAGLALGAVLPARAPAGTAAVSSAPVAAPAPSDGTGTNCPWKYVVTDGDYDDVLVYDTPQRAAIIARYTPRQVFWAPSPPVVVDHMMRTADGWVAQGGWLRRYTSTPCHTGSS